MTNKDFYDVLNLKIENKDAVIGVIGLGYVGLPLSLLFSNYFKVVGFDISKEKISIIKECQELIAGVSPDLIQKYINRSFFPTSDSDQLKTCDVIIICVPTPLNEDKSPDLSYIVSACRTISSLNLTNVFVIIESTTYPGTTDTVVLPILNQGVLKLDLNFGLAFSPERIDPGNKKYPLNSIPKIVGGINDQCTKTAKLIYQTIFDSVHSVKNAKTAEAVKILENVFRLVNIGLVNEMCTIYYKMGINIWDVIEAASTKPFGYMPFYPGPGVGGHCIPLDPFYLSYQAKKYDLLPRFIQLAGEINDFMPIYTVNLLQQALLDANKKLEDSNVLVCGLSYKKDIDDVRESPSIKIIEELTLRGAKIRVYDPYVRKIMINEASYNSVLNLEDAMNEVDGIVFAVDHDEFRTYDLDSMIESEGIVLVDCKYIFKEYAKSNKFVYRGIGAL